MKRYFVLCALVVLLGSTLKAEDGCHPFYVGASRGVSLLQNLDDDLGAIESDAGLAFSAFLGWNEGPGRLEFEYSRFNNEIDSVGPITAETGNIDVFAYMMNGYLDLPITSRLTGYVGGGLGVAQLQINSLSDIGTGFSDSGTSDFALAYQAKVGASLSLTKRAEFFGGYRFLGTEKGTVNLHHAGVFGDQLYLHSLETGLRFKF